MSDFDLIRKMYESLSNWVLCLVILNAVLFIIIYGLILALNQLKNRLDEINNKEIKFRFKGSDMVSAMDRLPKQQNGKV